MLRGYRAFLCTYKSVTRAISITTSPDVVGDYDNDATVTVTLSTTTDGADIYYTLDGSTPTKDSTLYEGPFGVTASDIIGGSEKGGTVTVKAIGMKSGYNNSAVATKIIMFKAIEEPVKVSSTYSFSFVEPDEIVANKSATINVTFANDEPAGDYGYDGVRFKFSVTGPGDATFSATDSEGNPYEATNEGYWGPSSGFPISAEYDETTPWTVTFTKSGEYTITVSLIEAPDGEVVAGITDTFTVNVQAEEPAIAMTAGEPTIGDGKVTLAVTTKNTGADYANARYGIKVNVADVEGDTISVSYGDGLTFNLNRAEGSDNFIGYFGPADGFTITNGWDVTTTFTVDFGTSASDRIAKVDAWVNQGAEPAEEGAVATMEQVVITIDATECLAALNAVNEAATTAEMQAAIEGNADVLGIDMESYNQLIEARQPSVSVDLLSNKPEDGYDLTTLQEYFEAIVATRLVTQASMDKANAAQTAAELEGYATLLLERFQAASEVYTIHSGIELTEKISTLQGLMDRYNRLDETEKTAVLEKVLELRTSEYGGRFARSEYTTDALAAALTEIEERAAVNDRLAITGVSVADNGAYNSTAKGIVRVLGYGIGINLDAQNEGKKASDTTSIVIELYKEGTLLGQQTLNEAGYEKTKDNSVISGTIDVAGEYVATSWDHEWTAGITDMPDKAVAKVKYKDGTATAEKEVSLSEDATKIFFAAEAVHALFENVFADELALAEGVSRDDIDAAETKVNAVNVKTDENKAVLQELITQARTLLGGDQETGQERNMQMKKSPIMNAEDPVAEEPLEIEAETEVTAEKAAESDGVTTDKAVENEANGEEALVETDSASVEGNEEVIEEAESIEKTSEEI